MEHKYLFFTIHNSVNQVTKSIPNLVLCQQYGNFTTDCNIFSHKEPLCARRIIKWFVIHNNDNGHNDGSSNDITQQRNICRINTCLHVKM